MPKKVKRATTVITWGEDDDAKEAPTKLPSSPTSQAENPSIWNSQRSSEMRLAVPGNVLDMHQRGKARRGKKASENHSSIENNQRNSQPSSEMRVVVPDNVLDMHQRGKARRGKQVSQNPSIGNSQQSSETRLVVPDNVLDMHQRGKTRRGKQMSPGHPSIGNSQTRADFLAHPATPSREEIGMNTSSSPEPFEGGVLPVASLVSQHQTPQNEESMGRVTIASKSAKFELGNKRSRIYLGVIVGFVIIGMIVGLLYFAIPRKRVTVIQPTSSPTLEPDPFPTSAPTQLVISQLGQSLFADDSAVSGPRGQLYFGWSVDLSSDGNILIATLPFSSSVLIFWYNSSAGEWMKTAEISVGDDIVDQVALSGDGSTLSVGMPGNSEKHALGGKVQVYENRSGYWEKMGDPFYGISSEDRIGHSAYGGPFVTDYVDEFLSFHSHDSSSLALSENGRTLAIGSSTGNYVRVFRFNENSTAWSPLSNKTMLRGEADDDKFGTSVDLSADGNIIVVGAPNNIGNAEPEFFVYTGHVRVFEYIEAKDSWAQLGSDLDGRKGGEQAGIGKIHGEQAGWSVSISDDGTVISVVAIEQALYGIGSLGNSDGYVEMFKYVESKRDWDRLGNVINAYHLGLSGASDQEIEELITGLQTSRFPIVAKLAGNGKRVAVSVPAESLNDISGRGVTRIYELYGEEWKEIVSPVEGTERFDHSGRSIALSFDGSRLAIGAPRHNENRPDDGEVRVFEIQSSTELAPLASSTQRSVIQIIVTLTVKTNKDVDWKLICDKVPLKNETVAENVTDTFNVTDGSICQLEFGERAYLLSYQVFYQGDGTSQPLVVVEGKEPFRDIIAFFATSDLAAVTVVIQTDRHLCETSWSLKCGNTTIVHPSRLVSGSIVDCRSSSLGNAPTKPYEETVMGIKEGAQCAFSIFDAFGDGLRGSGYGFYKIYYGTDTDVTSGMLLVEGGEFGLEETKSFTATRGPTLAPTVSAFPTASPAPSWFSIPITLFIQLDLAPEDVGWNLTCGSNVHGVVQSGTYVDEFGVISETYQVESGAMCELKFTDTNGDGLCCRFGAGFFAVYYGESAETGELLFRGDGDFGSIATQTFRAEKPSPAPPSLSPAAIPSVDPIAGSTDPSTSPSTATTPGPTLTMAFPDSSSPSLLPSTRSVSIEPTSSLPDERSMYPSASPSSARFVDEASSANPSTTQTLEFSALPTPLSSSLEDFVPTQSLVPTQERVAFTLLIQLDESPEETGWNLSCSTNNFEPVVVEEGTYVSKNERIEKSFTVDWGALCWFIITDTRSDGISSNTGSGFYRLYSGENVDDEKLFIEGGDFEAKIEVQFEVRENRLIEYDIID